VASSRQAARRDVDRLALVRERAVARDDKQRMKTRQLGDDILDNAVGEVRLLRVAANRCLS
jgi:hypothetical protein